MARTTPNKKPASNTKRSGGTTKRASSRTKPQTKSVAATQLLDDGARHDLAGLTVTALGVVLFVTLFTGESGWLGALTFGVRAVVGAAYYALPFALIAWGVTFFVPTAKIREARIAVGLGIVILSISGWAGYFSESPVEPTASSLAAKGGYVGWGIAALLDKITPNSPWVPGIILVSAAIAGLIVAGASVSDLATWARESIEARRSGEVETSRGAQPATPKTRRRGEDSFAGDGAAPGNENTIAVPASDRPTVRGRAGAASEPAPAAAATEVASTARPKAQQGFNLPPFTLLKRSPAISAADSRDAARQYAEVATLITETLGTFDVPAKVVDWVVGPTVTLFKVEIARGVKLSRITALADDFALALAAPTIRILAPIPGESLVGIEVPNTTRSSVTLGDVLPPAGAGSPMLMGIGKDVSGNSVSVDLGKLPHLLIGGSTGSGKSVAINAMLVSMIMRATPAEVRLILIDPKRVELAVYEDVPHLYVPVVTEPSEAAAALAWAVNEMERRLKVFQKAKVRDIGQYNTLLQSPNKPEWADSLPYLVIVIDELADLMMVAAREVESSIVRLAQLARAAGIHLIVATQRPEANIVTGLIKANITTRLAFRVATAIDSRVIIDTSGADKLTGMGDMLYVTPEWPKPKRIQGCYVSTDEIAGIVDALKAESAPDYHPEVLTTAASGAGGAGASGGRGETDPLFWDAAEIVVAANMGSTSTIQRRLSVGYARAGRIMDMLYERGIVGPPVGAKPRDVLIGVEELDQMRYGNESDGEGSGEWDS